MAEEVHTLTYRKFGVEYLPEVQEIYAAYGWTSYLGDEKRSRRALGRSLFLLGAFGDGVSVSFVRCVDDGKHMLCVQDLIIRPVLQRRDIGREFMRQVSEHFTGVRQFPLITDAENAVSNTFYRTIGLKTALGGYPYTAYCRGLPEA